MQLSSWLTIFLSLGIIVALIIKLIICALRKHTWLLAAAPMNRFRAPKDTHALKPERVLSTECNSYNKALLFCSSINNLWLFIIDIHLHDILYLILSPDLF